MYHEAISIIKARYGDMVEAGGSTEGNEKGLLVLVQAY
jgi:hypothetical protein